MQKINVDPNHVKYVVDKRTYVSTSHPYAGSTSSYSRYIDTIRADTSIIRVYPETMPEELSTDIGTIYYYSPLDTTLCTVGLLYAVDAPVLFEGCDYRRIYKNGFGEIYQTSSAGFLTSYGCGSYTQTMIAARKNGTPCGMPYIPYPLDVTTISQSVPYEIYPNPATKEITISAAGSIGSIVIYDVVGQKKYAAVCTSNKMTIDVSSLAPGVFIVVADGVHVGKFVKN